MANYHRANELYAQGDYLPALREFEELAAAGDTSAQLNAGCMYARGSGIAADSAKAIEYLQPLADNGDVRAKFQLGNFHKLGLLTDADIESAKRLLGEAADEGHVRAMYELADLFDRDARSNDPRSAQRWYLAAAERGHAGAQFRLGMQLWEGSSTPSAEAAAWCQRAADQDLKEALEWYRGAARQWYEALAAEDDAEARYQLAKIHLRDPKGPKEEKIALKQFTEAANQGHPLAATYLGVMYANGIGVGKDATRAEQLFTKAID